MASDLAVGTAKVSNDFDMKTTSFTKPKRSKRNKKIKAIDPFYTGESTNDRKKSKLNDKPKENESEFSNKMKEFLERKCKALQKKNKTPKVDPDVAEGVQFKQRKREKEKDFLRRVDYETQLFIQKTKMEDKFKFNSQKDDELFGVGKSKKMKKNKRHLLSKKQKQSEDKSLKRVDKLGDFEHLRDEIKFGEVAKEPPNLKFHTLKDASQKGSTNLLLDKEFPELMKKMKPQIPKMILDEERERAINLYRQIKSSKVNKQAA